MTAGPFTKGDVNPAQNNRLEHSSTSFSGESLGMTIEWITDISIGVSRIRKEMEKDVGLEEQIRGMAKELDKQISK